MAAKDYNKLRELLEKETYPHRYLHKFIGAKTSDFLEDVAKLEKAFPKVTRVSCRESQSNGTQTYIAFTFELMANNAEEIIELLKATGLIRDLKIIL